MTIHLPAAATVSQKRKNGFLANRCRQFTFTFPGATATKVMSRYGHKAMSAITSMQVVFQNFYDAGGSPIETGLGHSATTTASVEYPAGVFTQIKFGGNVTGTIPDVGILFSDSVNVTIPKNAIFWIRQYYTNPSGVFLNLWQDTATYGDLCTNDSGSLGTLTDQTMGGTVPNPGVSSFPPLAIIGPTNEHSMLICGDSIGYGYNDIEVAPYIQDIGLIGRTLASKYATVNISFIGAQAQIIAGNALFNVTNNPNRNALIGQFYSHVICQLGINDLLGLSQTGAQTLANLQGVWNLFTPLGVRVSQTTITPYSSSTDGWATIVNQTTQPLNAQRVILNNLLRALSLRKPGYDAGLSQLFEVSTLFENTPGSGLWDLASGAPSTPDGIHPGPAGYAKALSSGIINPT